MLNVSGKFKVKLCMFLSVRGGERGFWSDGGHAGHRLFLLINLLGLPIIIIVIIRLSSLSLAPFVVASDRRLARVWEFGTHG